MCQQLIIIRDHFVSIGKPSACLLAPALRSCRPCRGQAEERRVRLQSAPRKTLCIYYTWFNHYVIMYTVYSILIYMLWSPFGIHHCLAFFMIKNLPSNTHLKTLLIMRDEIVKKILIISELPSYHHCNIILSLYWIS